MYRYSSAQKAIIPFAIIAGLAITTGGLIAAIVAHAPTQPMVWLVAYLVLVAGVAQLAFGAGQAFLAEKTPSIGWVGLECVLFNIGNASVIAGTLLDQFRVVAVGGVLVIAALALFLYGVHGARRRVLLHAYRALLVILFVGAVVGVSLSAIGTYS